VNPADSLDAPRPSLLAAFVGELAERLAAGEVGFVRLGEPTASAALHAFRELVTQARTEPSGLSDLAAAELVQLAVLGQQFDVLARHDLPTFGYRYLDTYEEAVEFGPPRTQAETSFRPHETELLGRTLRTPIGIGSSVLTASPEFVLHFARNGYSLLTYKTMRTRKVDAYLAPNWTFVAETELPADESFVPTRVVTELATLPKSLRHTSTVNSFGLPSPAPDEWQPDVRRTLDNLPSGCLLAVSVVGSFDLYQHERFKEDFVLAVRLAVEAGAEVVELNLSCPNVLKDSENRDTGGLLCEDVPSVTRVVDRIRTAFPDIKLIAKLGLMDHELLREFTASCGPLLDAVAAINSVRVEVLDSSREPLFPGSERDPDLRREAGLSGSAVRGAGLGATADLRRFREEDDRLDFEIVGTGGVLTEDDYDAYRRAGADFVQAVTGAFVNPSLARQVCAALGE
jgi:dihydroorotate dehydrogenase